MSAFQYLREGDDELLILHQNLHFLLKGRQRHSPQRIAAVRKEIARVVDNLPVVYAAPLAPTVPPEAILQFLEECKQDYDRRMEQRKAARHALPFSSAVQQAFDHLEDFITGMQPIRTETDNRLRIPVIEYVAFTESLVLEGAAPLVWQDDWYECDYFEVARTDNGYQLIMRMVRDDDMPLQTIHLHFTDVHAETAFYDYMPPIGAPWDRLREMLDALRSKNEFKQPLNDCECRLLPLVDFEPLSSFGTTAAVAMTDEQKAALLPYTEQNSVFGDMLTETKGKRWRAFLHSPAAKPFWRRILVDAQAACGDYPQPTADFLSAETRNIITEQMHANGLNGEYPHFTFKTPLQGICLANNGRGQTCILGGKEQLQGWVYLEESPEGLQIYWVTTVIKPKQIPLDAIDAHFVGESRLYTRDTFLFVDNCPKSEEWADECRVISKIARMDKLTRAERRSRFHTTGGLGCGWIFAGLLFGLLMTAVMMLVTLVATLLLEPSVGDALAIFRDAPFGWIFLFTSVAFGGIMWLLERLAR